MSFHLTEINRLLKEGSITMNTRRYSIKLMSVETLDPKTLAIPKSFATVDHNSPMDKVEQLLQRRGEDSKAYFLTDGVGHKEMLLIQVEDKDEGKSTISCPLEIHFRTLIDNDVFYRTNHRLFESPPNSISSHASIYCCRH